MGMEIFLEYHTNTRITHTHTHTDTHTHFRKRLNCFCVFSSSKTVESKVDLLQSLLDEKEKYYKVNSKT